jgi:phospholipase C
VSPWSRGGWVCSETFDHTSVLRFLEKRFGVEEPNISAWRRSVCGDLTSAFDFAGTADHVVPTIAVPPGFAGGAPVAVPARQTMPIQEPGVRPARALGYAWTVEHRLDRASSRLAVTNTGTLGAAFLVYDGLDREAPPRRYAVSAGKRIEDRWALAKTGDAYDRRVHGPHGYLAHLRGFTDDTLEAVVSGMAGNRQVDVRLSNHGDVERVARVANGYARHAAAEQTLAVAPGGTATMTFDLAESGGWYDIAVTLPAAPRFLRRFAGHHEDGRRATSDPGGYTHGPAPPNPRP